MSKMTVGTSHRKFRASVLNTKLPPSKMCEFPFLTRMTKAHEHKKHKTDGETNKETERRETKKKGNRIRM